jgi:nucleoid-associated protein YgaU
VYRRRRATVALIVVIGALALLGALTLRPSAAANTAVRATPSGAAASAIAAPVAPAVYVVQPGDTLWSIARSLDPKGDVRRTVDQLVELNGGAAVQTGQRLRLP